MIRSILVGSLLCAVLGLRFFTSLELPWTPLLALLLVMVFINLGLFFRFRSGWPASEIEFFANLLLDVFFLTAVLYFTGGSTNPLVSYYLIPLIISAAVLRPRYTWAVALMTVACYTLLFFRYVPFELFAMSGHGPMMAAHFWGMWINFVFSAVLISWFVVRMATTLRWQEHAMAQIREDGLRDEQIISVASIAAGTAHELRTPLATMTLLVDELKTDQPELLEELSILQGQLARCDNILNDLVSTTDAGNEAQRNSVEALFTDVQEKWSIARPEVKLQVQLDPRAAVIEISYDQSFHHALLNFLHNAADASPDDVRLSARPAPDDPGGDVMIVIEDRGAGIPEDVAAALGRRYISRKEGGLGLGVLLSSASVERLGGQVTLLDRPGGGTRLEIRLPDVES